MKLIVWLYYWWVVILFSASYRSWVVVIFKFYILYCFSCNISNLINSVSSGYPNTEKRVENMTQSGVFLMKFEVFWIANETLSQVFDIPSQSKQKLKSKPRGKIIKIQTSFMLVNFFVLTWWIINEFENVIFLCIGEA